MTDLWLSGAIFSTSKYSQIHFRPDPAGGAYDAVPDPLVGWGEGTPPHSLPPSTPPASRSRRLRRLGRQPPNTNSWLRL